MLQSLKSDHEKITLRSLLESYRDQAISDEDKQAAFEKFVIAYLTQDPLQKQEYEKVPTYREAADEKGWKGNDIDTDIDLVAKVRDQEEYVAIRCQFYETNHQITQEDIESFIAISGKSRFKYRLLIDSTEGELSENANTMIEGQTVPVYRIHLFDLENSQIDWRLIKKKDKLPLRNNRKKSF